MQIKPIKSDADLEEALRKIEQLWGAAQGTADGDRLDVLASLAEAYEREHFPIDKPDPVDAIKFRLEQEGKDYRSLVGVIGHRTRVYEVMRRDRPLSLSMIRRLHERFRIPADVLLNPMRLRSTAAKRRATRGRRVKNKRA